MRILPVWSLTILAATWVSTTAQTAIPAPSAVLHLSRADYVDRVAAVWTAQIVAVIMAWPHEHQVSSALWLDHFPKKYSAAPVDDDWYYEMCAVRGFEKYGIGMSARQLGEQWLENHCGSWGSSEQARLNLERGIKAPDSGHPRYNNLKTVNLAARAADFTDADCNAANAVAVIGAMHGMKSIPKELVAQLGDRIVGSEMGGVKLTPPVDGKISELARRTAAIGEKIVLANGGKIAGDEISIPIQSPVTQPAELFRLSDLMAYWNPEWKLERAGFGGAGGGMGGIRGITYLAGEILATYPRDEVRGLLLTRTLKLSAQPVLHFQAGVDADRAWELNVYCGNKLMTKRIVDGVGKSGRQWEELRIDLAEFAGREATLRLYQRVLVPNRVAGNAYWKELKMD